MARYLVIKNSFIGGLYRKKGAIVDRDPAKVKPDSRNLELLDAAAEKLIVPEPSAAAAEAAALMDDDVPNDDDALVAGTVAELSADLGAKSDEELDALEAAEKDREAPRKGLLGAIEKERAARAG